jgi:hypothetical protein
VSQVALFTPRTSTAVAPVIYVPAVPFRVTLACGRVETWWCRPTWQPNGHHAFPCACDGVSACLVIGATREAPDAA